MKSSRYTEEQIIGILKQHQAGLGAKEICRKYGISDATFYKWRSRFTRWILENRPALPVILVSGDLGKANAAAGLTGVETFAKPYDFDAAVRKIRATLERGSQKTG